MPNIELPPKRKGEPEVHLADLRSLTVVGANGSGKSRMGAWIEKNAGATSHRVSAQRALALPFSVHPRPYEEALSFLYYGRHEKNWTPQDHLQHKDSSRWNREPTSSLLNDFEHLLALLFADEAKRNREYSRAALKSVPSFAPPRCKLDVLADIWASVMPHRELLITDASIKASAGGGTPYEGRHMSDGERVAVYLIGQSLCAPDNSVIVIDEPEIHLHRAISAPLWDQIELARSDCTFVYITHDLDFAATRIGGKKIWIKSYDGSDWDWNELDLTGLLPEHLLFEVLGNRRPILFVEGDSTSYDATVYAALYPGQHVVPRESCEKVIEATKAMSALVDLHRLAVRGIVDRDRRGDKEITSLRDSGILVADVAEVENLLCLHEAIECVARKLETADVDARCVEVQRCVMVELRKFVEQQALSRALTGVQFQLNGFGPKIGKHDSSGLATELQRYLSGISVESTVAEAKALLEEVLNKNDYRGVLRLFNHKGMLSFVSAAFRVAKDVYVNLVLGEIQRNPQGTLSVAMRAAIEAT